jgi:hypothetical protein
MKAEEPQVDANLGPVWPHLVHLPFKRSNRVHPTVTAFCDNPRVTISWTFVFCYGIVLGSTLL